LLKIKLEDKDVLIRVQYKDDSYDTVAPYLLNELISSDKIKKFFRSEGWVIPGMHQIRVIGEGRGRSDRRRGPVTSRRKQSEYKQDKGWMEKALSVDAASIIETKYRPILFPVDTLKMSIAKLDFYSTFNQASHETVEKIFVNKGYQIGKYMDSGSVKGVLFPVCLAIMYGDTIAAEYPDFILNISESWVFVKSESPISKGNAVLMHFYIPPEYKLLAEIKGEVAGVNRDNAGYPNGMLIKCDLFSRKRLRSLKNYLEGKSRLIDNRV
jgi:hypothetical protein